MQKCLNFDFVRKKKQPTFVSFCLTTNQLLFFNAKIYDNLDEIRTIKKRRQFQYKMAVSMKFIADLLVKMFCSFESLSKIKL